MSRGLHHCTPPPRESWLSSHPPSYILSCLGLHSLGLLFILYSFQLHLQSLPVHTYFSLLADQEFWPQFYPQLQGRAKWQHGRDTAILSCLTMYFLSFGALSVSPPTVFVCPECFFFPHWLVKYCKCCIVSNLSEKCNTVLLNLQNLRASLLRRYCCEKILCVYIWTLVWWELKKGVSYGKAQ